jgi:DNA-binding PadR family transcriptional regulator
MTDPGIVTQNLARSCNEALILSCLEAGPMHGYQIALEIERRGRGFFRFNYGTLYPILHKLEKDGLVKGVWSPGERRPAGAHRKRKSYTLTPKGRRYARDQRSSWRDFIANFLHVLDEVEA